MSVEGHRRLAAKILGVGFNRVWIDPGKIDRVETAITRDDLRRLIRQKVIRKRRIKGISRGRARLLKQKRSRGRRRGPGSREGTAHARLRKKTLYVNTIRAIRKRLKELKESKSISNSTFKQLYRKSKGGSFKNTANVDRYIETNELLRKKVR